MKHVFDFNIQNAETCIWFQYSEFNFNLGENVFANLNRKHFIKIYDGTSIANSKNKLPKDN